MKYQLTVAVLGRTPILEIDQERYEKAKHARSVLVAALALEEIYEILLSNYIALEREILHRAAEELIRSPYEYEDLFRTRLAFNVRLANLLTAARLYVDQVPRHVRKCICEEYLKYTKKLLNKAYDSSPQYRFMEALRNHVQHNGVAVHSIRIGHGRNADGLSESGIELIAKKKLLSEDKEFKKKVLDEIGDEIDLILSARAYMECLGNIHTEARSMIKEAVDLSRDNIERERKSYENICSSNECSLVGLEAQAVDSDSIVERVNLLLDWDDVRRRLVSRNGKLTGLTERYASGRSRGIKADEE